MKEKVKIPEGMSSKAHLDSIYKDKGFYPSRKLLQNSGIDISNKSQDVYFIQCTETKRIKIGMSNSVAVRFDTLQGASPTVLELLCVIEYGGLGLEQHLHKKFARYRIKREWFEGSPELLQFIEDIKEINRKNEE